MSHSVESKRKEKRGWVSYWALLLLQVQNAFNDKAAQFLLISLGVRLHKEGVDVPGASRIEYILAAIIVIPFILFSPLAGWLSDRFSKTYILRGSAVIQLLVLIWITLAIYFHMLWFAVAGFFFLSIQSVIFSPAKRGIVKELVGSKKLGFASGIMEVTVVLAICLGQIVTGFWYRNRVQVDNDGWNAALFPLIVLAVASMLALSASFGIHRVPVSGSRAFKVNMLYEHFSQLKELWKTRALKLSAVGVAFFWGYAGFINLAAIAISKEVTKGDNEFAAESAVMILAASIGIIIGGAVASLVCRKKIELGLVPLGGVVMVIGTLAMAFTPIDSIWMKLWFIVGGAGGSLVLVPLNANIQDICEPEKRGKVLAAVGLLDCLAGLSAVMLQLTLVWIGVPFMWQFIGLAIICFIATRYAAKILPDHFVRLLVLGAFKVIYRVKAENVTRVPEKGGVLMLPNHVSYIDAFILSVACPREIRFLMFEGYFKRKWIGAFVRLFGAVPISQTKAKDAIRVAAEALEEGAVVCIFPEGQLCRTGVMNEFKRGFEMVARKSKCPVLPVAMDGIWGSIFSFERSKFIYKIPYRCPFPVTVNFGEPITPENANAEKVRWVVESLRAEVFAQRPIFKNVSKVLSKTVNVSGAYTEAYQAQLKQIRSYSVTEQQRLLANAIQMGEVNAIKRGEAVMIDWSAVEHCLDVVAILFPQYLDLTVVTVDSSMPADELKLLADKYKVDQFIGGKRLAQIFPGNPCYDFSIDAIDSSGTEYLFPCLVIEGTVISMSMPHPAAETATNQHQEGYQKGSWGRLLPGFELGDTDQKSHIQVISLSTPEHGIELKNMNRDQNGMLVKEAPFKAQNMSFNSYVTPDGLEME